MILAIQSILQARAVLAIVGRTIRGARMSTGTGCSGTKAFGRPAWS